MYVKLQHKKELAPNCTTDQNSELLVRTGNISQ